MHVLYVCIHFSIRTQVEPSLAAVISPPRKEDGQLPAIAFTPLRSLNRQAASLTIYVWSVGQPAPNFPYF